MSSGLNARDLLLADSCSNLSRSEINEYVLQVSIRSDIATDEWLLTSLSVKKLEKQNPTADPAGSPLLNGVWEVVTGGVFTSPGLLGLQIIKALPGRVIDASDVTITISSVAPRVVANTSIKVQKSLHAFSAQQHLCYLALCPLR